MTVSICIIAVCAVLALAVLMFFAGLYAGGHKGIFAGSKKTEELSEEELNKLKRDKRELENFWSYTGENQKPE